LSTIIVDVENQKPSSSPTFATFIKFSNTHQCGDDGAKDENKNNVFLM
jgi:hypothetical protein